MALRYAFPINTQLIADESELRRLPVLRAPKTIEYNGVADKDDFLQQMSHFPYCKVKGPTGVGKSLVLPKVIASETKRTVLVVCAHPLLAQQGYRFFKSNPKFQYDGSELRAAVAVSGQNVDFAAYDIVWMSAAYLTAWLVARKSEFANNQCLKDMIVFLDEAHESDAYTHIVRTVTPHMGLKTLLLVSATFEPSGHVVSEEKVKVVAFDALQVPKTWDIHEPGKPWSKDTIENSALIFIDNAYDAVRLAEDYRDAGFSAFRLHARSLVTEYLDASAELVDPCAPPTVIIVDSSFRSGFNFDVDMIIDSGTRYLADGTVGVQATFKRPIYNVEFVQTAGRGGRFGRRTTYYMPDIEPQWRICDLEAVEAEGAAYITRVLGFMPSRPCDDAVLAKENFPPDVDVNKAFEGEKPLTCYVRDAVGNRLPGVSLVKFDTQRDKSGKGGSRVGTVRLDSVVSQQTSSTKLTSKSLKLLDKTLSQDSIGGHVSGSALDMLARPAATVQPYDSVSYMRPKLGKQRMKAQDIFNVPPETEDIIPREQFKPSEQQIWLDVQNAIVAGEDAVIDLGAYLFSPDVVAEDVLASSRFFPEREKTLMHLATNGNLSDFVQNISAKHVKFALYHCLRRHNLLNLEVNTIKRAMISVMKSNPDTVFDVTLRRKFTSIINRHIRWELERDAMFNIISTLSSNKYAISSLKDFSKHEEKKFESYYGQFSDILNKHILVKPNIDDWIGEHRSSSELSSEMLLLEGSKIFRAHMGDNTPRKRLSAASGRNDEVSNLIHSTEYLDLRRVSAAFSGSQLESLGKDM